MSPEEEDEGGPVRNLHRSRTEPGATEAKTEGEETRVSHRGTPEVLGQKKDRGTESSRMGPK